MTPALGITLWREGARLGVAIMPPPAPPVTAMMLGRAPEVVAELMPRLFNLCGVAQGQAARAALGLPPGTADLRQEILRDHLAKLCLHWPRLTGLAPQALPQGWAEGGAALTERLWGGSRPAHLARWLASGAGMAPVLEAIATRFAPGEACADLPPLTDPMALTAQENSPAGRVAEDPLMRQAEAVFGRGPLWRALGRLVDLTTLCEARPEPVRRADGSVCVTAARGTYALRARAEGGRVTALERVTPTDHLVAPGGVLEMTLAALPAEKLALADLVVDILDPCVPVLMTEAADA